MRMRRVRSARSYPTVSATAIVNRGNQKFFTRFSSIGLHYFWQKTRLPDYGEEWGRLGWSVGQSPQPESTIDQLITIGSAIPAHQPA